MLLSTSDITKRNSLCDFGTGGIKCLLVYKYYRIVNYLPLPPLPTNLQSYYALQSNMHLKSASTIAIISSK